MNDSELRAIAEEIRKAISNAYYGARNNGQTMEEAADNATENVLTIVQAAS